MRTIKTAAETEHIRTACRIAEQAFDKGVQLLRPGITEVEGAAAFRISLSSCLRDFDHVKRCDGFMQCMSGLNSSKAFGPYPRSHSRTIEAGDLVILRCQCYANGYWADVARTYHIGPLDDTKQRLFGAVISARNEALRAMRPGARAAEIDGTARRILDACG